MRVALFGSPGFARPTLDALLARHDVVLVVAQPDKPAGRGKRLSAPPLAARARELGLRLEQPPRLKRNEAFLALLAGLDIDVAITAAYGKILPQAVLDVPKHGFLNVHASLLPHYRGAAPIQWALIRGEHETGVSIMQTEAGLDTGPVRLQKRLSVAAEDTALTLFDKLAALGAAALTEALERLEQGDLPCEAQNDAEATHAPLLSKNDGLVRWQNASQTVIDRYRGVFAWPGSFTQHGGTALKLHAMARLEGSSGAPGKILNVSAEGVSVACGEGAVLLTTVQPPGKPKMAAKDWAHGYGVKPGTRLGAASSATGSDTADSDTAGLDTASFATSGANNG